MTKKQEIEILRTAIAALGPDSYCGPWLYFLETLLRADSKLVDAQRVSSEKIAEATAALNWAAHWHRRTVAIGAHGDSDKQRAALAYDDADKQFLG